MIGKNKPSRGEVTEEIRFSESHLRGERKVGSRFERWLMSLRPAMPNATDRLLTALGQVNDKHICEIGCGRGELTRELATRGARVSAIDVSAEAVRITQEMNKEFVPKQVEVQEMDACNLLYSDESFDLAIGVNVLHHVDIVKAAEEISRVLKPGGKGVFVEPLTHNPISNVWRRLTPTFRTADEWPLSYPEIREMGRHFSSVNCQEFALLTLLTSFVYLITHSYTAKQRSAELLARLEPRFLRVCKPLRRYSGMILIEFTK